MPKNELVLLFSCWAFHYYFMHFRLSLWRSLKAIKSCNLYIFWCDTDVWVWVFHLYQFIFSAHHTSSHAVTITNRCEFHNDTMCKELGSGCNETQECNNEENKRNHCFVLWQNNSKGQPYIKLKVIYDKILLILTFFVVLFILWVLCTNISLLSFLFRGVS